MSDLIPVLQKDLKKVKEELLKKQKHKCPITGKELAASDREAVVDHQHKQNRSQEVGEDGAGLIRGVLDFRANSWEGKVNNSFRRCGLRNMGLSLPETLRKLADYLEQENTNYIHPSELPKPKKLGKRVFNKINKLYLKDNPRRSPLEFPKSGKITKKIENLAKLYQIEL